MIVYEKATYVCSGCTSMVFERIRRTNNPTVRPVRHIRTFDGTYGLPNGWAVVTDVMEIFGKRNKYQFHYLCSDCLELADKEIIEFLYKDRRYKN